MITILRILIEEIKNEMETAEIAEFLIEEII